MKWLESLALLALVVVTALALAFLFLLWSVDTSARPGSSASMNTVMRWCNDYAQDSLTLGSRFSPAKYRDCLKSFGYQIIR